MSADTGIEWTIDLAYANIIGQNVSNVLMITSFFLTDIIWHGDKQTGKYKQTNGIDSHDSVSLRYVAYCSVDMVIDTHFM